MGWGKLESFFNLQRHRLPKPGKAERMEREPGGLFLINLNGLVVS